MATASPSHVSKEKLTDELSCSLCLECYKQPKVLQCQHTFCLPCLQRLMGGSFPGMVIICPLCRERTIVPNGNLEALKTNYIVENLLTVMAQCSSMGGNSDLEWSGQTVAKYCQLCQEEKKTDIFCDDCKMWLCKSCSLPHNRLPATKSHRTMAVADIVIKAKDKLKVIEKEMQGLQGTIEEQHQKVLMNQEFLSEQANKVASQIEASWRKAVDMITEKKVALMQDIAVSVSQIDAKQQQKVNLLQEHAQRIKEGLSFVKDVRKSSDAHLITNMFGHVETVRQSVLKDSLAGDDFEKCQIEFHAVEPLSNAISSSSLGHILCGKSVVDDSPVYPNNAVMVGELVHRLAYGYYITGMASAYDGSIFVASNCNSLKKIKKGVCEVEMYHVVKPWGVVKAPSSELILTDCGKSLGGGSVNILDLEGKLAKVIATGLSLPRGVAVDSHGRIYVCDENDRCVYVMTPEGRIVHIIKYSWDGKFLFEAPRFITINQNDYIFISDGGKFLKVFDTNFQLKWTYKSPFARPEFWDIFTADVGVLYVADWNHGIHIVSEQGEFLGLLKQPFNDIVVKEPTAFCLNHNRSSLLVGTSNGEVFALDSMETE
ncbi:tripartite motif-containing protein 2-like [Haliotis asinina]|uniref:tripartite motif-containing protein 2-like n=1 Tax=Haliotis asinina TaxID=109174 RepID=UPI0035322FB6